MDDITTALSTFVVTPFAQMLHGWFPAAAADAQAQADSNDCPVGVWARDGWFTVCEIAPELIEPDPELRGWQLWAVVDPTEVETNG